MSPTSPIMPARGGKPLCPLGFGTSQLGARISRRQSLRLLEVAFDAGIRHFDTAPMYGYGTAETILGEFLRSKRDQVTVATKFGIEPPKRSAWLTAARKAAKLVISLVPSARKRIARHASTLVSSGNFDVPYARMSLERSLRALATDYVDMLLMHEVALNQITPELLAFAADAVTRGQVTRYSVASTSDEVLRIVQSGKPFGSVVQMPYAESATARISTPADCLYILHSIFSSDFKAFAQNVADDRSLAVRCSQQLDIDCSDAKRLGRLFLWTVMRRNEGSPVVFSSMNEESIRRNAALLHTPEFTDAQAHTLERMMALAAHTQQQD